MDESRRTKRINPKCIECPDFWKGTCPHGKDKKTLESSKGNSSSEDDSARMPKIAVEPDNIKNRHRNRLLKYP